MNADVIARGLAGFDPDSQALQAARIMLDRLNALAAAREDFALETTLASRSFVPWIRRRREEGYDVQLAFLALPSADLAVQRVAERVRRGGHDVPEETVRRRFARGLHNLFRLYLPAVNARRVYDNSRTAGPRLVAHGSERVEPVVVRTVEWKRLKELVDGGQGSSPRS